MSLSAPQAAALLASSFANAQVVVCVEVATATLFFYDYLTTLSSEVELVWLGKWGAGKILFLLGRYVMWPELMMVFYYALFKDAPTNCRFAVTYSLWSVLIGITVGDVILVLRTWAVCDTSRTVLVLLATLLCCSTATNAYYLARYLRGLILFPLERLDPSIVRSLGRHSCPFTAMDREIGVLWVVVAAFELVVFVLTAVNLKGIARLNCRTSRLVSSIYRDGTLYFLYLFGESPLASSASCLLTASIRNLRGECSIRLEYVILLAIMQGTFHSILTCRLILHIRAVAREDATLALSELSISTVVDSRAAR
ncbi:hypothetical protein AURDEDRAFT_175677 [Auricularia subglabra TFB-10046 SS5]|uniref:DUF6533 domain-containing protein n=1 Tax=Auricularia subglabra (strain TFB-10046 / SS5) TaxID=717982 RepID=J0LEI3_AURST|nr:hypothetical protein AURDEDRAFT_175677 [Auricularia subglabra TFB-10046 SS5]